MRCSYPFMLVLNVTLWGRGGGILNVTMTLSAPKIVWRRLVTDRINELEAFSRSFCFKRRGFERSRSEKHAVPGL